MATNGNKDMAAEAKDTMRQMQGRVTEGLDDFRGYMDTADGAIRDFARERPLMAVACAVGIGFLIGRLASRT